jgi:ferredoxin
VRKRNQKSTPKDNAPLRVTVDGSACKTYGICHQEAPEVFEVGTDGRLRFRTYADPQHAAQVYQAARCCPTQAIIISGGQP